jgi:hypothetical protein
MVLLLVHRSLQYWINNNTSIRINLYERGYFFWFFISWREGLYRYIMVDIDTNINIISIYICYY